jgi:hypothetical protein
MLSTQPVRTEAAATIMRLMNGATMPRAQLS